jgi:hypothetical protein
MPESPAGSVWRRAGREPRTVSPSWYTPATAPGHDQRKRSGEPGAEGEPAAARQAGRRCGRKSPLTKSGGGSQRGVGPAGPSSGRRRPCGGRGRGPAWTAGGRAAYSFAAMKGDARAAAKGHSPAYPSATCTSPMAYSWSRSIGRLRHARQAGGHAREVSLPVSTLVREARSCRGPSSRTEKERHGMTMSIRGTVRAADAEVNPGPRPIAKWRRTCPRERRRRRPCG